MMSEDASLMATADNFVAFIVAPESQKKPHDRRRTEELILQKMRFHSFVAAFTTFTGHC